MGRARDTWTALAPMMGRAPYRMALEIFRAAAWIHGFEAWARHSYLTSAFRPGRSDLDLTLWCPAQANPASLDRTIRFHENLKRWMPWVGELNVFEESTARAWARFANPIDLGRDPKLRSRLDGARTDPEDSERAAYLLRMADADARALRVASQVRAEKWIAHFAAAGIELPNPDRPLGIDRIVEAALRSAGWRDPKVRAEFVQIVGDRLPGGRSDSNPTEDSAAAARFAIVMPHRLPTRLRDFDWPAGRALVNAQLRWELWGVASQWRIWARRDRAGLLRHLERCAPHLPPDSDLSAAWSDLRQKVIAAT